MEAARAVSSSSATFLHMVDATLSLLEGCKPCIVPDLCLAGSANGVVDGAGAPDSAQVALACRKVDILGHQLLALAQEVRQRQATHGASSHDACAIPTGFEICDGEPRYQKRMRDDDGRDVDRHRVGARDVKGRNGTSLPTAASVRVINDQDLLQHVFTSAAGDNIRYVTRLACVSRAWRDAVYSAHGQWEDIAHRSLPFTQPPPYQDGGLEHCTVLQGLLRSAGGYRGLLMRHREAVWLHRHGGGGGAGGGEQSREKVNIPTVLDRGWYEHLGLITEVYDRLLGDCLVSCIGPLEWAGPIDYPGEAAIHHVARFGRGTQGCVKFINVDDMRLPWEMRTFSLFDYIDQDRRFVARVLVVTPRGAMKVLCAWEPMESSNVSYGGSTEEALGWKVTSEEAAYEKGTCGPVTAQLILHVVGKKWSDSTSRYNIELAHGELQPRVNFTVESSPSPHNVFAEHMQTLLSGL